MLDSSSFTPVASLLGGVLIGAAASMMLVLHGRIAGVSGVLGGVLRLERPELAWRVAFLAGMLLAGLVARVAMPQAFENGLDRSAGALVAAGLLVGVGTRLGSGCTSGHGVCGIGRASPRSLVATLTFMATGVLTVLMLNVLGWNP